MLIQPKKNRNKKGLALIGTTPNELNNNNNGSSSGNILIGNINSNEQQQQRTNSNLEDSLPNSANTINSISSGHSNNSYSTTTTNNNTGNSRIDFNETLTKQLKNLDLNSTLTSNSFHSTNTISSTSNNNTTSSLNELNNRLEEPTFKLDLNSNSDLKFLSELGSGNGGTVSKCLHLTTNLIIAKKVVHIATSDSIRKQILRELQIMHDCNSPYIISFYGAYLSESHICMCMEFMDKGSLDNIYKSVGPIPELILSKIALAVVTGLDYLYEVHKIMHRDIKPSNILLNSKGEIKMCDFGVSGELINSVADTFVGTSTYMSPERISGDPYTVKSDVWSLGITLVELAIGRFPFSSSSTTSTPSSPSSSSSTNENELTLPLSNSSKKEGVSLSGSNHQMSILELLQFIVNEDPPTLSSQNGKFGKSITEFVDGCLKKEPMGVKVKKGEGRPTPRELLEYEWLKEARVNFVDVEAFAKSIP